MWQPHIHGKGIVIKCISFIFAFVCTIGLHPAQNSLTIMNATKMTQLCTFNG